MDTIASALRSISEHNPFPLSGGPGDLGCVNFVHEREQRLINTIQNVLVAVAETIEVLEVACLRHFESKFDATNLISLPRLKELTTLVVVIWSQVSETCLPLGKLLVRFLCASASFFCMCTHNNARPVP